MKTKIYKFRVAFIITLALILINSSLWAQSPDKMSYQAVIRNASNNLVTSSAVGMQISILQGSASGTAVYVERHFPTTNANGLVSIEIGAGTIVSGSFANINWANGIYFVKTETDLNGGANYTITGTSRLLSVPYALHAKTVETITEVDGSVTNEIELPTQIGNSGKVLSTNGTTPSWTTVADNSATNEIELPTQTGNSGKVLSTNGTTPSWTTVADNSATNEIELPTQTGNSGKVLSTNGTAPSWTTVADNSATNEIELPTTANTGDMSYWNGTAWVVVAATGNEGATLQMIGGVPTWTISNVTNPSTGKIWMNRNLGASQVATSSTDAASYGYLYQWGRGTDGHQIRTSGTTATLSSIDNPGHSNFITPSSSPYDWRSPQNTNLWQGVSGTNNPCPSGYRVPTDAELDAERGSWSSQNSAGAFASPLKLPVAGYRNYSNGSHNLEGSRGYYWSSTVSGTYSRFLYFHISNASLNSDYRAYGFSMRCIKD